MKTYGKENYILGRRPCGMNVTLVGSNSAYSFPLFCKTWKCEKCRKDKIKYYIFIIRTAFNNLTCVHLFVGQRPEKRKKLSNFITKYVGGHYCRINGMDTSTIISDKKFDGAKRRDKNKFLENTLPEILDEPWEEGRRISFSRGWIEPDEKKESDWFAMIDGDLEDEYKKLSSDAEKREWLKKQTFLRTTTKGKEFLNQKPSISQTRWEDAQSDIVPLALQ